MPGLPIESRKKFANRRIREPTSSRLGWLARTCSSRRAQRVSVLDFRSSVICRRAWTPHRHRGRDSGRSSILAGDSIWIGCSTEEAVLLADAAQHPTVKTPPITLPAFVQKMLMKHLQTRLINPAAFEDASYSARLQRAFDT